MATIHLMVDNALVALMVDNALVAGTSTMELQVRH